MSVAAWARHALRPLVVACVVLPAVVFGGLAWLDYRLEMARGRELVSATADTLAEHAQTVLETSDLVLGRVLDRIHGDDWATLSSSPQVYQFLLRLKQELPQLESVFLVNPIGLNVASSRLFPFPPIEVSEREYFQAGLHGPAALHVSAPFRGILNGTYAFTVSRPRMLQGRFDGIVGVTISPDYFIGFYRRALRTPFTASVRLVRTDGTVLVRYPAKADAPAVLGSASHLLRALSTGGSAGVYRLVPAEGRARLVGYRRLAGQPLAVSYAIDDDAFMTVWRTHAIVLAVLAVLLSTGLLTIERLAAARTAREHAMLRSLVAETERRQHAETVMAQMQKMEALGRLTGGVAHDFNNLLAAILGSLELAAKRVKDERLQRLLSTAAEAAQRGARLTAQMLAFSRQRDIAAESVDPNALIRGIEDMLQRSVGPLVHVHYELAVGCWPVLVDPVQLEVALLNLAVNARDAMPLGGDLSLRTSMRSGHAVTGGRGDFVRIDVSDSGAGMSEDVKAHAFEPFYTTKGPSKGTGLGLSMVYGYVTQIGGTVLLDSAPGQGTTVSLLLPRAASGPLTAPAAAPALTAPAAAARVLLVDDDASVRLAARAMLEDLGHEVVALDGGAKALEHLATDRRFDVVLLDYAMPVMTGAQLAAAIVDFWPEAPILFMTGYVEVDILQPWLLRGYRTLRKPFTSAELAAAIGQLAVAQPGVPNVIQLRKC